LLKKIAINSSVEVTDENECNHTESTGSKDNNRPQDSKAIARQQKRLRSSNAQNPKVQSKKARGGHNSNMSKCLSVAETPATTLKALTLKQLKLLAKNENFESGWQAINGKQRPLLLEQLCSARKEFELFYQQVSDAGGIEGLKIRISEEREDVKKSRSKLKKRGCSKSNSNSGTAEVNEEEHDLDRLVGAAKACVHIVPNGSGVNIAASGLILTCAHCISGDDDPRDEDEDDVDGEVEDRDPPAKIHRLGRFKTVMFPNNVTCLTKCVAVHEEKDCALLEVVKTVVNPGLPSSDSPSGLPFANLAAAAPGQTRTAWPTRQAKSSLDTGAICIGNPYDWDLELPSGAAPRWILSYQLVWFSCTPTLRFSKCVLQENRFSSILGEPRSTHGSI
jgi:hypothetical protein